MISALSNWKIWLNVEILLNSDLIQNVCRAEVTTPHYRLTRNKIKVFGFKLMLYKTLIICVNWFTFYNININKLLIMQNKSVFRFVNMAHYVNHVS